MPLSLQVHHAVVDGIHVGRFFQQVEAVAARAQDLLNSATDSGGI